MRGGKPEDPMSQIRKFLASIRIVYKKTPALTRIVVAVAIVLSTVTLLVLRGAINETRQHTEELRQQAIVLEQEQKLLDQYEQEKYTVLEVIRIAMERLGLVKPDSIVIQPE